MCRAVLCVCVDHGEDKFILADYTLLPTILKIAPNLPRLQGIIVLTDRCGSGQTDSQAHCHPIQTPNGMLKDMRCLLIAVVA